MDYTLEDNLHKKITLQIYVILLVEVLLCMFFTFFEIYLILPILAVVCITLLGKENIITKAYLNFLFLVMVVICTTLGKEYDFIPQAEYLLNIDTNPIFWISEGHYHAIRLIVAYPGYLFSAWFDIPLNTGFTYYCYIIFIIIYYYMLGIVGKITRTKTNKENLVCSILIMFFVMFLVVTMNGRLIFAFCGISLVLCVNVKIWCGKDFTLVDLGTYIIAVIMATVSSGTLVVVSGTIALGMILSRQMKSIFRKKQFKIILLLMSPVFLYLLRYIAQMVEKNLVYFGGLNIESAINMLNHGVGRYIYLEDQMSVIYLLFFGGAFLLCNFLIILRFYRIEIRSLPLIVAINIAGYGLLFGLSTGLIGLVPFAAILIYAFIENIQLFESERNIKNV